MRYLLGLDNGGTVTKAAIYTLDGHEVGVAATATRIISGKPGFIERDMEEMWYANCQVIREVLSKTGIPSENVIGVAVCGHGKGLYLWGKNGKPVRNGIVSTDNRAYAYPLKWLSDGTERAVFDLSCQHIMACQPVSLLAWLCDNEPECMGRIRWVFECKDYVRFRLTGEARAELTDYSGSNLVNLHTKNYDDMLLEMFGLSDLKASLPPLCQSTEIVGYVSEEAAVLTGLKQGTPVAGGLFDLDACLLAAKVTDEENICMIAGSWSVNLYLSSKPVVDGSVLMNSLSALPNYYLIEESSPASAGNLSWFIKNVWPELDKECKAKHESIYTNVNKWVDSISAVEYCPVFLPFLTGSYCHPNARACFVGMSNSHTREHIARSIYEGVAFSHKQHLERLLVSRHCMFPKVIRLTGGAANSPVWSQMFADVMGFPVETIDTNETGALGCAIVAATALGVYGSVADAAESMSRISAIYMPKIENHIAYEKKYELYKMAISALNSVWDEYQKFIDGSVASSTQ